MFDFHDWADTFFASLGGADIVPIDDKLKAYAIKNLLFCPVSLHHMPTAPHYFERLKDTYAQLGENVVFIYEDVWQHKREVCMSRIRTMCGFYERIHARQTHVVPVTQKQLNAFMEQHHLNVNTKAAYSYGLYISDRWVAMASFGTPVPIMRHGLQYNSVELIRFASQTGIVVTGGLSKLIRHAVKELQADDIMTYADADWSIGASYRQLGFQQVGRLPGVKFWLNTQSMTRLHAHKADIQPTDPEWLEVYNAGSYKFIYDVAGNKL